MSRSSASFLVAATMLLLAAAPTIQAQNPDDCAASGEDRFACLVENQMTLGDATTTISSTINCLLEPNVGMNFLEAQDCRCQATLTDGSTSRVCNCGVCPTGTVSLDCSGVTDNPYIFGQCSSMNCAGQCGDEGGGGGIPADGTTPAPAPTTDSTSGTTDATSAASSLPGSYPNIFAMAFAGLAALLLG